MESFNLNKLNEVEVKQRYCVEVSNLDAEVNINSARKTIRQNINSSAKENLGCYVLKN
jgi:hypothetical protein